MEKWLINKLIDIPCKENPDKVALITQNHSCTYQQLQDSSNFLAASFQQANLTRERIAILLPNSFELVCTYLACFKSGAIAVPLEFRDAPQEMAHVLEDAQPKWLIIHEDKLTDLKAVNLSNTTIEKIFVHTKDTTAPTQYENLSTLLDSSLLCHPVSPVAASPIILLYTSGSTGLPKGVIYTYDSTTAMIESVLDALMTITSETIFVIHDSVSHIDGLLECLPTLYIGGTVILRKEFNVQRFFKDLEQYRPTIIGAHIDTLWQITRYPTLKPQNFQSVDTIFTGGEELPLALQREFFERTGKPILVGYGMTESIWLMITTTANLEQHGAMGKPVNNNIKIRLVDKEGRDVVQGDVGEIWVNAPMNTAGYWNNTTATKAAFSKGWFKTGDCAKQDMNGNYWFSGRIKHIIERKGENITPFEIEQAIYHHPAVREVGVIGTKDLEEGEVPIAFVTIKKNNTVTESELKTFLQTQISEYKIPAKIFFIENLPLTHSNKVDRKALKKILDSMPDKDSHP